MEKLPESNEALKLKSELFEKFARHSSLEEEIKCVLDIISDYYSAVIGEFWINTPGQNSDLIFYSTIGANRTDEQSKTCASTEGFVSTLWNEKTPRILNHLQSNEKFLRQEFASEKNLTSVMGLPLLVDEKVLGVMCFFRDNGEFVPDEILPNTILEAIASHLNKKVINDKYGRYFAQSRDVFAIIDMSGYFLEVNNSFLELLGYSENEVIGKHYTRFVHKDDLKPSETNAEKVCEGEATESFENRYKTKTGNYKCIRWSSHTDLKRGLIYATGKDISDLISQKYELSRKTLELKERVKELNGLYSILKILNESGISLDDKLSLAVEFIPSSFQYPDITCAEIMIAGKSYRTIQYEETSNKLSVPINIEKATGKLSVYLTKENISFLKEEKKLVESIASNISGVMELEKSRSLLHRLSLISQETTNFVIICNDKGQIEWVNPAFEESTGYKLEEISGKKPADFLHGPDTEKMTIDRLQQAVINLEPCSCELLKYKKDKTPYWVSIEGKPLRDPTTETMHYFQIETDITESKNNQQLLMEAEQNARRFANELNRILEEERAHWAREIHDEIGQQLSGIKLSLATLDRINFDPEASKLIVSDVVKSLDRSVKSLKTLSAKLRPGILDNLGLAEAVEWLVDEFMKKSDIRVIKRIGGNGPSLDRDAATNIFRICQETLNNIAKHANATKVEVDFDIDEEEVVLKITDNGVGIKPSNFNNPFSMGLLGMKERARLTGASLRIESEEGKYTKITFRQNLKTHGKTN